MGKLILLTICIIFAISATVTQYWFSAVFWVSVSFLTYNLL